MKVLTTAPCSSTQVMCRFRCEWLAVTRLSRQEIKRVIKHPDCNAPLGRSLSWLKSFTFAESPDAEPLQGGEESRRPQVVTEMHGWLRLTLNYAQLRSTTPPCLAATMGTTRTDRI